MSTVVSNYSKYKRLMLLLKRGLKFLASKGLKTRPVPCSVSYFDDIHPSSPRHTFFFRTKQSPILKCDIILTSLRAYMSRTQQRCWPVSWTRVLSIPSPASTQLLSSSRYASLQLLYQSFHNDLTSRRRQVLAIARHPC